MTQRQTRLLFLALGFLMLGVTAFIALTALKDNLVYFKSPTDIAESASTPVGKIRIGGLVAEDSLTKIGLENRFVVTDLQNRIDVSFEGVLPDLFREGQGVVAEGQFKTADIFVADTVLAKHDENYMPREVADALKETGVWQGNSSSGSQE
ncbi:MAG: cytochrome c maturation protein CcmE [Alphaproteobacteria bacterium]|nr:cytochrome c maturation protein CcmE [Alphaproteobacteria bacterium]